MEKVTKISINHDGILTISKTTDSYVRDEEIRSPCGWNIRTIKGHNDSNIERTKDKLMELHTQKVYTLLTYDPFNDKFKCVKLSWCAGLSEKFYTPMDEIIPNKSIFDRGRVVFNYHMIGNCHDEIERTKPIVRMAAIQWLNERIQSDTKIVSKLCNEDNK